MKRFTWSEILLMWVVIALIDVLLITLHYNNPKASFTKNNAILAIAVAVPVVGLMITILTRLLKQRKEE